jgi:hypothetical protein
MSESPGSVPVSSVDPGDDDPRLAFIYQEALRGLLQQQGAVESLHNRAGTLIFAASFASSLLGAKALSDGIGLWDWIAVALLVAIGALVVFMLWPYYNFSFRFDPQELIDEYVDTDAPVTMSAMHRSLALRIRADFARNGRLIRRIREALQLALILLMFEILAWLVAIAAV